MSGQQFFLSLHVQTSTFKHPRKVSFHPRKLNYELLGNSASHLHWHIFPRYADDPSPNTTSWKVDKTLRYADAAKPDAAELNSLKEDLLDKLTQLEDLKILSTWNG